MDLQQLKEAAREINPQLVTVRRELHQHPELSMEEYETTRRIRAWLEEAGLKLLDLSLPTGVIAEVEGSAPGPTVALRADIDALPVTEETGLPFASLEPGKMHACGHDFHTASMIGAAILLHRNRESLRGRVRIIFQPAEETAVGARAIIEAGALDGVDAILGMHNKPELPVGTVGIREGALMASVDRFEIRVTGKGGHGAIPDAATDPIVAASSIVTALQTVVSRNLSPLDNAVVSVCRFQAGATWNVIPDYAELEGTVRTFQAEARKKIPERIRQLAENIAAGYGATAELRWTAGLPAVNNEASMAKLMKKAAEELGLEVVEAKPTTAGEDFSLYQERVPGCFIWMGTGGTEEWHHPRFTLNEDALPISAALFAHAARLALDSLS
jgi:amidohydrolase